MSEHALTHVERARAEEPTGCVGLFCYCSCDPGDWVGHIYARPRGTSCSTTHAPCWEYIDSGDGTWTIEPSIDASRGGHFHTSSPVRVQVRSS